MDARAARPDDYERFMEFWIQLGLEQAPPPRERWASHLCPNTLFLEDGGALVAYALCFPFGARGDVRQIVVDRAARNRGVGKALMATVATKLRAAGCTEWRLECKADNTAARALYAAVGMRLHRDLFTLEMTHADCERFAATRSGRHQVEPVTDADDAALEAALDLGHGQLARWRSYRAHCPMLRVGATAFTQVWRDFAPDLGLLFPFTAPDGDVAAHLMAAAIDSGSSPPAYELCITDAAVHVAVLAAGARAKEHQVELTGSL